MKEKEIIKIPLKDVVPDENQPRKYFDPVKINHLKESIKKFGIMNPITVEKIGEKYLLVDGERRFRAATDVKLKEVPAIVIAPQSAVDRLIQQFHLQEQHQEWTATEKAQTVGTLATELGLSIKDLGGMLGLDSTQVSRYTAFHTLIEKKEFEKHEINIQWAPAIRQVINHATRLSEEVLKEPMTHDSKRKLERAIITQIKEGELVRPIHLAKLRDSFTKSPKDIKSFIDQRVTVSEIFLSTKAQGAYHLRNMAQNAAYVVTNGKAFLKNPDAIPTPNQISNLKEAKKVIDEVMRKLEI